MKITFSKVEPLSFDFGKKESALWGSGVEMESPGVYQLLASSGSGKSTLIAFLSGLRSDYAGKISYDGEETSRFSASDWSVWRSRRLSFVFQDLRLFGGLSVRENILLSQQITGALGPNESLNLTSFCDQLHISSQLDKPVRNLSMGQMQRVAIIRAVLRNYQWLFLDEPFSHLDHSNAVAAWNLILQETRIRGAGILITCLDPYDFISPDKTFYL